MNALRAIWSRLGHDEGSAELGDFTTTRRVVPLSLLAVLIGVVASYVALALLKLIGLFTNLFFYQRWSTAMVSPAGNRLGLLEVLVPVAGALLIGLLARYGSEKIRGHGIPEAIEAILLRGGKVVVEDGQVRAVSEGREFIVHPDFDPQIEDFIRPQFQKVYTLSFENYPTEMSRLHHPEVVPCTPPGPVVKGVVPPEPA